jgi:FkbM family methyltransferase
MGAPRRGPLARKKLRFVAAACLAVAWWFASQDPLCLSEGESAAAYYKDNIRSFSNKADFRGVERLLTVARAAGLCDSATRAILVGDVNEGQLSDVVLQVCRGTSFHGFEIQRDVFRRAKKRLRRDHGARVAMHRSAWSDTAAAKVAYSGEGETASLFVADEKGVKPVSLERRREAVTGRFQHAGRFGDWTRHAADGVSAVTLADVADRLANSSILYAVIDVEGHEPKVLRGMQLESHAKRFPLFQYELGGTWGHHDPRHGGDWSQERAASYLNDAGYELYLVATTGWLRITPDFFPVASFLNGGDGCCANGNVLAVHPGYAPPAIVAAVRASAETHALAFAARPRACRRLRAAHTQVGTWCRAQPSPARCFAQCRDER